jgi:hypothetical protein
MNISFFYYASSGKKKSTTAVEVSDISFDCSGKPIKHQEE